MAKRLVPTGPMVLITDEDIKNLKYIRDASKTLIAMAKWTNCSVSSINKWLKGEHYEVTWRQSVKKKMARIAGELNPEPINVPVFSSEDPLLVVYQKLRAVSKLRELDEITKDLAMIILDQR